MSDSDEGLIDRYGQMTPGQKWQLLDQFYKRVRQLHAAYVRVTNPHATDEDVLTEWFRATLDRELFDEVQEYRQKLRKAKNPHSGQ